MSGMDRVVATKTVRELVSSMVEKAPAAGSINLLVAEIEDHGQEVRNEVEQRLKVRRLEEESGVGNVFFLPITIPP